MTTLSLTEALMNNYASIALLGANFYGKTYSDNQFSLKADVPELTPLVTTDCLELKYTDSVDLALGYYNKAETCNMLLSYSACSYVGYAFCAKAGTDTLLADKLIDIGDIPLPGMLDIGTSNCTNPRMRCNADVNGYTGFAELRAASSYDMYLDLFTTRTDGGWMYFKANNDDYIQLPGSGNKVNICKDTSTSVNLDVGSVTIDMLYDG